MDTATAAQTVHDPASTPPLSKSAQKKAAKAAYRASIKLERRARERERRKEKKNKLGAQKRAADDDDDGERKRPRAPPPPFGARVVLDLGFDEMMTDKEILSLCSQLAYTYSANRRAAFPFSLLFTSLDGRTSARLDAVNDGGYKRWSKTEWWVEGYERLWDQGGGADAPPPPPPQRESVVYLTADSDEELMELQPHETYIIGGLCDHNRYKNLCLNKSRASGVRSARLPIGRYLASLQTRKVLTVNQVFEILVKWVETRDWEQAFYAVIPKRKFQGGDAKARDQDEMDDAGDVVLAEPEIQDPDTSQVAIADV